jgi:hypothetical protein
MIKYNDKAEHNRWGSLNDLQCFVCFVQYIVRMPTADNVHPTCLIHTIVRPAVWPSSFIVISILGALVLCVRELRGSQERPRGSIRFRIPKIIFIATKGVDPSPGPYAVRQVDPFNSNLDFGMEI